MERLAREANHKYKKNIRIWFDVLMIHNNLVSPSKDVIKIEMALDREKGSKTFFVFLRVGFCILSYAHEIYSTEGDSAFCSLN